MKNWTYEQAKNVRDNLQYIADTTSDYDWDNNMSRIANAMTTTFISLLYSLSEPTFLEITRNYYEYVLKDYNVDLSDPDCDLEVLQ